MNKDIQIFACLCIGNGVLDVKSCQKLKKLLDDDVELLEFAQAILDHEIFDDFDAMQEMLDQAVEMSEQGDEPPFDPFMELKKKKGGSRPSVVLKPEMSELEPEPESEPKKPSISLRKQPEPEPEPEPVADEPEISDLASAVSAIWQATGEKPPENAVAGVDMSKVEADPSFSSENAKKALFALGEHADQMQEFRKMAEEIFAQMSKPVEERTKPREAVVKTQGAKPVWPDPGRLDPNNASQMRQALIGLLLQASEYGASDVHISADSRLFIRRSRNVEYISESIVSRELSKAINTSVLSDEQREFFDHEKDYDFAMPFDSGPRFRVNLMEHKDGVAGTYRIVPARIPDLADLGFDPQGQETITKLLAYHNGLILVTGPVGAGKTTTLSSLVDILNATRQDHIITVEEPIEVIQKSKECQITQRGVGPHTQTFKSALKGALRQDPDIIVIGEMRDLETIEMAISASETGHLVIGTMHTSDASTTLNRLLDVFPPAQQPQIRAMVAESLRGILCQRLLPAKDGNVALCYELLLKNTAVSALIREGKSEGLSNIIETGKRDGMVLMDNSIMGLWEAGRIDDATAIANLRSDPLKLRIRNGGASAGAQASFVSSQSPEPPKKKGLFGR
ncbi:type IV pilus twitching motility protein PilT [Cerasicoccus fimbriatus]|uniref:type IV pilus twitching motility protein PilT n=1 Tax=Cerasicoccus fimbriatus TaxID=3014554 RepID=UPI0022B466B6|nr:PilT/PilU family type 4a pilus ATPase [Cerasicoccus sp. TK19100]